MHRPNPTAHVSPKRIPTLLLALHACLICLCPYTASAQSVGASLNLEGRAAISRAVNRLIETQHPDGCWLEDAPLTALAADALRAADNGFQDQACRTAITKAAQALRHGTLTDRTNAGLPLPLRLFMLLEDAPDSDSLKKCADTLTSLRPGTPSEALWTADALVLASRRLNRPLPRRLAALDATDAASAADAHAFRLALAVAAGNSPPNALKALYSAARNAPAATASMEALYWSARAFRACGEARLVPQDNWQADILSALLERQRGDGSWHTPGQSQKEILRDTALAIHIIILCLSA